jgi:hypothetical protein
MVRCPACGALLELALVIAAAEAEAAERRRAWEDTEAEALLREAKRQDGPA